MKTEYSEEKKRLFFMWCKKVGNFLMVPAYAIGAHWYDVICGIVSNEFSLLVAMVVMFTFLFSLSTLLVGGHAWLERKTGWDLMGLEEFKGEQLQKDVPWWRIFKRLKRWMTKTRKTMFWAGSIVIGPPVVAIMLRSDDTWKQNFRYIISGTALSVIFWVLIWKVVGIFTWDQYILPFFNQLTLHT